MKKYSFSKRKGVSRSKNSKKHRRVSRKTFRNKMMKGGFNNSDFAGAFAVAAAMDMNKVVLIPKPGRDGIRYDVVLGEGYENTNTYNRPITVDTTGRRYDKKEKRMKNKQMAHFNNPEQVDLYIEDYDIYVGSTRDNVLIKMDGNKSVLNRLAAITNTVIKKENSTALIETAQSLTVINPDIAENLQERVNEIDTKMLTNGQGIDIQDNNFIKLIQIILALVKLLFDCLESVLNPSNSRISGNEIPTFRNEIPQSSEMVVYDNPSEVSTAIVNFVTSEDPRSDAESAEAIYDTVVDDIGKLTQYIDNDDSNPIPENPSDNQYRCVTPYDKTITTDIKARSRSCNKVGIPARGFEDKRYKNNGLCYTECIKK
jgi:hypothetical protein